MGQFQEMHEDTPHLAAHGISLALAQILDLLGKMLAVEAVIAGAQRPQNLGLVSGPGVEIVVVARSVRHRSSGVRPIIPGANRPSGKIREHPDEARQA